MSCSCIDNKIVDIIGLCDPSEITLSNDDAWVQLSIPEVLRIPCQKPDIEEVDKVFIKAIITSKKLVETPERGENLEGVKLTGKKFIVEGILKQRIVYTANVREQSVHSACFNIPFSTFIVVDKDITNEDEYCIESCIEDVYVRVFNRKEIFKNVTLFLRPKKITNS